MKTKKNKKTNGRPLPGLEYYQPVENVVEYAYLKLESVVGLESTAAQRLLFGYAYIRIREVAEKHLKLPDNYIHINKDYRSVAQAIFDCPVIFTNRASKSVLTEYGEQYIRDYFIGYEPKSRVQEWRTNYGKYVVMDHEYPRAIAASTLIKEYINSPFSEDYFVDEYINKYGLVNLVSDHENGVLGQYSKKNVFVSPKVLYQNCGIALESLV